MNTATSVGVLRVQSSTLIICPDRKLRQGRAQQTLFNMSVALLCSEVVVLVGLKQTTNYGVCLAVAVLLHYFILVSFLWMLIEAVLQYLTFVKVLGTYISKYTLKTVLPAWGEFVNAWTISGRQPCITVTTAGSGEGGGRGGKRGEWQILFEITRL